MPSRAVECVASPVETVQRPVADGRCGRRSGATTIGGVVAWIAVFTALACPTLEAEEPDLPTAASTTRRLLDALDERQMPDVALWVLDRVAADTAAPERLKREVPFRRAAALLALSRGEAAATKRAALLDRAAAELDRFLGTGPEGDLAIDGYLQQGNLLIERGRGKLEQAKRPGEDAGAASAEAAACFDAAIRAIEGPKRVPGAEIETVANAEDAVLKELRQVDAQLAAVGAGSTKDDGEGKTRRPPRRSAADTRQVERLEERQDELRGRLLSTRLLAAGAYAEKARALAPNSKEWHAALDAAASRYRELAEKYRTLGVGLFARYYEGRTYATQALAAAEAEERKKGLAKALATLADIRGLEGDSGIVPGLRAKAIAASLECWLDENNLEALDDRLLRIALVPQAADRLDPDVLAMKVRAATMLERRASALPDSDKAKRVPLLRDSRKLAQEVARFNRDHAREARDLLERLGRSSPVVADGDDSFAAALDMARVSLAEVQAGQAAAKQARAAGEEESAALVTAREKAIAAVRRVIPLAGPEDLEGLNQARYWLTFLMYDAKRLHEAAALGDFLARSYPNAKGGRQAATIAMASWQQLARVGPDEWRDAARKRCAESAERILRTWPADAESGDAGLVAIAAAMESHDADRLVELLDRIPADLPRRGELLLRAGGGLWREVQDRRRSPADSRPPPETLAAWRGRAVAALDTGLAVRPADGPADAATVAGATARGQIALEDGDLALAGRLLEDPRYGPWTVMDVDGGPESPALAALAEGALATALRYFVQSSATDPGALVKAQRAMERLEKLAGSGDEAAARLTAMYLAMGRDLEGQLRELAAAGATVADAPARTAALLGGFEKFLDGVARRDPKPAAQLWVGSTYLALGSGGSGASRTKAAEYLEKAATTYEALLARGGDDVGRFEPSLRLRLASAYQELGRWDEALAHLDWVLSDPKRQNALDVQTQAASLLRAAGERVPDKSRADTLLRESIVGRTKGASVIWGWGGIANKLSRQAFASEDSRALEARARFFEARYNVAAIRLARARKSDTDRAKLLEMAYNDVAITAKLYPGLGGEASRTRFDALLREIQRERGVAQPAGLAELEAKG